VKGPIVLRRELLYESSDQQRDVLTSLA